MLPILINRLMLQNAYISLLYIAVARTVDIDRNEEITSLSPYVCVSYTSWLRGSVVERRSSAGVLSPSCARPVADG